MIRLLLAAACAAVPASAAVLGAAGAAPDVGGLSAGPAILSGPTAISPSFAAPMLSVPGLMAAPALAAAPAAAVPALAPAAAVAAASVLPARLAASAPSDNPAASGRERPSASSQLDAALTEARAELYRVSGGSADGNDVSAAQISVSRRADYFRSPTFRNWVAAEKAEGRQVFWLKDIDKTQASGDIFTYFFQWRAQNGKITPAQNEILRSFLKTVTVKKDPTLKAALKRAGAADGQANAQLVIDLWRSQERGGEGIGLLDFWSKIFWPTQKGLTREEKLAEVQAFAPTYAAKVYPGQAEENRTLTEAGVEVVAVSNGDQELAVAVAGQLGLKPENVVGSNLTYDANGIGTGVNHAYEMFDKDWTDRPQAGKHLTFHYWVNANKSRWGWEKLSKDRVVIAGADGDSASTDGGMWVYFPDKAIGNFMVDTPHEPGRVVKSRALAAKYGWDAGRFFTLTHAADSPKAWDDVPAPAAPAAAAGGVKALLSRALGALSRLIRG